MTSLERSAWFELTVATLAAVAYGALFLLFGSGPALGALALMALTAFGPSNRGAARGAPRVALDERDHAIMARSSLVGYSVFWLAFVAATMGVWALRGGRGSIAVDTLPLFPAAGWVVLTIGRSIATLVQYARGR